MKIYLSGKITDQNPLEQAKNIALFFKAEQQLQCRIPGAFIYNPATLENPEWSWEDYMAECIDWLLTNDPVVYMMKGWENSQGARLEHRLSRKYNLIIWYE